MVGHTGLSAVIGVVEFILHGKVTGAHVANPHIPFHVYLFHRVGGTNAHIAQVIIDILSGIVFGPIGEGIVLFYIARTKGAQAIQITGVDENVNVIILRNEGLGGNLDEGVAIFNGGIGDSIITYGGTNVT